MFEVRYKKYKTELITYINTDKYTDINSDITDVTDINADLTRSVQWLASELDWKLPVPVHNLLLQQAKRKDRVNHMKIFLTHR